MSDNSFLLLKTENNLIFRVITTLKLYTKTASIQTKICTINQSTTNIPKKLI
jgi:hypothetical protein